MALIPSGTDMNPNPQRAPVFFISHGSPMFALEPGQLGPGDITCGVLSMDPYAWGMEHTATQEQSA